MSGINPHKTYHLNEEYASIKERAIPFLDKYLGYQDLITFNDMDRKVTFSTERLIPPVSTTRARVMLLFSNPHPLSVHQGMFLSKNSRGQENLFWPTMEAADWLPIKKEDRNPERLAEICLKAEYQGPFDLIFYCYYAFPTDFPEDISKIFGRKYFSNFIEPESIGEFNHTIRQTCVDAVVTFNKGIFNSVSKKLVEHYIEQLIEGELIQSQVKDIGKDIPIFLTFPTGWRYHKDYMHFRKSSLERIRTAICSRSNGPVSKANN